MGIIAKTAQTSAFALNLQSFWDLFGPLNNYYDDLPHVVAQEKYTPLLEKAAGITQAMRDKAEIEREAGFMQRTQSGAFAWAGPPGPPEARPPRQLPEQPQGGVFTAVT